MLGVHLRLKERKHTNFIFSAKQPIRFPYLESITKEPYGTTIPFIDRNIAYYNGNSFLGVIFMTMSQVQLLIIDDSPEDREVYRVLLDSITESKYCLMEAASGEAGLALYRAQSPDCILLDYYLPDLD